MHRVVAAGRSRRTDNQQVLDTVPAGPPGRRHADPAGAGGRSHTQSRCVRPAPRAARGAAVRPRECASVRSAARRAAPAPASTGGGCGGGQRRRGGGVAARWGGGWGGRCRDRGRWPHSSAGGDSTGPSLTKMAHPPPHPSWSRSHGSLLKPPGFADAACGGVGHLPAGAGS